ncbi:MAG: autoinducer binding domain-containing protein [Rhodobacteraceae bacterium]|jgi:LuxR family transcriptional regulator|nr:autoinducer binding domain-containing protein [Paracoccaceae bacterium]
MTLLEHISRVTEAQSIEDLWSLHVEKMREFGFSRLIYGFTRFRSGTSFGSLDDILILSNHSQKYVKGFIHAGLYKTAPMVTWAAYNEGACSWRLIEDMARGNALTEDERAVVAFNQRMGLRAGYTISFRDGSVRNKGAIGLAARPSLSQDDVDAIWDRHGQEIHSINSITHLKITSMPYKLPRRPLTKRQREVLEWVGDGKTIQDIATIMGLTPTTVEKHLRLARDVLEVDTTAQAVLKAAYQNQIFVLNS